MQIPERGIFLKSALTFLACFALLAFSAIPASAQMLNKAEDLYKKTSYQASLNLLDKQSADPATIFLIGRDYFMLGEFKKSTEYLLKATAAAPENSEYMDWLGRSYGKRAETSSPLFAPSYASKAREAFEEAVKLDPKNSDALSDLFDYYLSAPGFLGGGFEKAAVIAQRLVAVDPPEGYFVEAKLEEKRQQLPKAEQRLRQAIAAAPHQVGHMVALATFLANEGRTRESDDVFLQAEKVSPGNPAVLFAKADTLIRHNRKLDEAKLLLQKYMQVPVTVDDPPRDEAARLLKQLGGA
jgi:tetratricopeptide (TPR) repeat protein